MRRKRNNSDSADLFGTVNAQPESSLSQINTEDCSHATLISSPLVDETKEWLSKRALTLGNMLSSERAAEYVACLRALAQFREEHEPEPLHEDVELKVCGEDADAFAVSAFKSDIRQLKEWGLVAERIEKERLRGYRDNRRTKFRYRICDDAARSFRSCRVSAIRREKCGAGSMRNFANLRGEITELRISPRGLRRSHRLMRITSLTAGSHLSWSRPI